MQNKTPLIIILLLLAAVFYMAFTFSVREDQTALKLRLGEIAETNYKPGLHFKIPIWNQVLIFDHKFQTQDSRPEEFLTIEKKSVVVDSFIKWKIQNVETFYRSTGGDMTKAGNLIAARINTALRDEFAKRTVKEVVSGERTEIMQQITEQASQGSADLGIKILDVRVKRIDFPKNLNDAIFQRMRTERHRIASELRAEGTEEAVKLQATAERQRTEILSSAYSEAEKIRGEGDATAAETYASAFNRNPEFYAFWRSLTAYREVFSKGGDVMVLQPDSEFFRFLNQKKEP
jgi:membrane protease subunit HflC